MDTQRNQRDAATDSKAHEADAELAGFVRANRVQQPMSQQTSFAHLNFSPESVEAAAAREAEANRRAELRSVNELRERFANLVREAGPRYRSCTLDNFECKRPEQRTVVGALREYIAKDFPDNVIAFGPVGCGKDHLLFSVCAAAIKAGKTVRWINGQSFFGVVRDAMDTSRSEATLIAELARPELLCISDPLPPIGALTQFQAVMMYRMIDSRYTRGAATLCSININDDAEADERLGEATWDRLCHDALRVHCNWPSHRKPTREVKALRVRSATG